MPKFIALSLLVFLFIACDSNPVIVKHIECDGVIEVDSANVSKYASVHHDNFTLQDGQCQQVP